MTGAPKVLRRCTICRNFHASYRVEDAELGECYLCLRCWRARSFTHAGHVQEKTGVNKTTEGSNEMIPLERGELP
jgi:hypothetical protein